MLASAQNWSSLQECVLRCSNWQSLMTWDSPSQRVQRGLNCFSRCLWTQQLENPVKPPFSSMTPSLTLNRVLVILLIERLQGRGNSQNTSPNHSFQILATPGYQWYWTDIGVTYILAICANLVYVTVWICTTEKGSSRQRIVRPCSLFIFYFLLLCYQGQWNPLSSIKSTVKNKRVDLSLLIHAGQEALFNCRETLILCQFFWL